jgi:hypothetical protein
MSSDGGGILADWKTILPRGGQRQELADFRE